MASGDGLGEWHIQVVIINLGTFTDELLILEVDTLQKTIKFQRTG